MYQKRSAWVLTGVAPNRGPATSLRDVVLAVQTEIPLVKQHLSDQLWAVRGEGAQAHRCNRLTGERVPIRAAAVPAREHRAWLRVDRRAFSLARATSWPRSTRRSCSARSVHYAAGKAHCFEDQYASTGGQLYELAAGHDRFVADLRPLLRPLLARQGLPAGAGLPPLRHLLRRSSRRRAA